MLRPFSVEQSATYSVDSVAQRIIDWAIIMLLAKFGVSLVICDRTCQNEALTLRAVRHNYTALTYFFKFRFHQETFAKTLAQLVECRNRNRETRVRIPVVTVSKFGHFLLLHDASVDSAV